MSGKSDSTADDIARAEGLVGQALAISPRNLFAHYAKGQVLRAQRRCPEAIPEYEAVLASSRNWVYALFALGQCKLFAGLIEEAIPLEEQAIRLSTRDPYLHLFYSQIGYAHLLQSRTDEAVGSLEKSRSTNPASSFVHAGLAAALALKDETDPAAIELAEARRLSSDDRYASIARLKTVGYFGVPSVRALFESTFFAGLRKAGMPDE